MLEPSLAFYAGLFGAHEGGRHRGAAVHAVRSGRRPPAHRRLHAEGPADQRRKGAGRRRTSRGLDIVVADDAFLASLDAFPGPLRLVDDGGRHGHVPVHLRHDARAARGRAAHATARSSSLMVAALYGTGVRPGDEFFCPSSPAWGHGLWHGTLAPLALGVTIGAYAGRFDAERLMKALQDYRITNLSAAATHYRMMKNSRRGIALSLSPEKAVVHRRADRRRHARLRRRRPSASPSAACTARPRSASSSSNYPGAPDFPVKPGSLGKPVPGVRVEVQDADGEPRRAQGRRRDQGLAAGRVVRDQGPRLDRRGRLLLPRGTRRRRHHLGRLDDERRRDRERAAEASGRARSRRHRRAGRGARAGRQGLRRHAARRRRCLRRAKFRTSCASGSASTNIRARSRSSPNCPRRRPARSTARCCASASKRPAMTTHS